MSENGTNGVNAENEVLRPAAVVDDNDAEDLARKELELKRKERDPPIVFQDTINVGLKYIIVIVVAIVIFTYNIVWYILNRIINRYKMNWND